MDKMASLAALLLYFALLLLIVLKEKKNHTVEDYFFAGRSLPFWALSITFVASWWGAGSALSTADLAYDDGFGAFWYYGVPVLLATLLMTVGARRIRGIGYLTQGRMMAARYSPAVAGLLSLMILLFMIFSAASQMVGIGDFFGGYLGFSYETAVLLGTGIVLIYSLFGGFRGVVLTDILQCVLLAISALVVCLVALEHCGGLETIALTAQQHNKTGYMNFWTGAEKYLPYVVTFGCSWMIQANIWQRISAARSTDDARRMTTLAFFLYIPLYLIVVFTGMAGLVLFESMPQGGVVTAVVNTFLSPLGGAVVFVGIAAAIMSTMDSLINTGAMTLALDLCPDSGDERKKLAFSRMATALVTGLALLIALRIRSFLDVTWIASDVITTGAFVPLVLGFFWRRGNSRGALASMLAGLCYSFYNLFATLGLPLPMFWKTQTLLQTGLGVGLSLCVYIGVSLLTPPEYEKADTFMKGLSREQADS